MNAALGPDPASPSSLALDIAVPVGLVIGPALFFFLLRYCLKYRKFRNRRRSTGRNVLRRDEELPSNPIHARDANHDRPIAEAPASAQVYELPAYTSRHPPTTAGGTAEGSTDASNTTGPRPLRHLTQERQTDEASPAGPAGTSSNPSDPPVSPPPAYITPDRGPLHLTAPPLAGQHDGTPRTQADTIVSPELHPHEGPDAPNTPLDLSQHRP
ncbi:MAG: hypothetical protein Q9163_003240 [Psora crenata]